MMEMWRAKFVLGTLLTSLTIVLSYEIENLTPVPKLLLVIVSFFISLNLANFLLNLIFNYKIGRMLILGKSWIEGHWYIRTLAHKDYPNDIARDGIVYISYEGENYLPSVTTYRMGDNVSEMGFSTISDFVIVRSFDLRFSNIFTFPGVTKSSRAISTGKFFSDGLTRFPNRFEGNVVFFEDAIYRRQTATKIPAKIVKKYMNEYGYSWENEILSRGYPVSYTFNKPINESERVDEVKKKVV